MHHEVDINPGHLLQTSDSRTRGTGMIRQHGAQSIVYHQSFYPRSIREWNKLPTTATDIRVTEEFAAALDRLIRDSYIDPSALTTSAM